MKDIILGIVRHSLTAFGGALVANGTMNNNDLSAIVGGLIAAAGVVCSILEKRNRTKTT